MKVTAGCSEAAQCAPGLKVIRNGEKIVMKSSLMNERWPGTWRDGVGGGSSHVGSTYSLRLAKVNQELWLVLSLFIIAGLINWLVASHRLMVGFYTLPTLFSAYVYGRRHAVLTASASIFIVVVLVLTNKSLFASSNQFGSEYDQWAELATWAGLLLVIAYS